MTQFTCDVWCYDAVHLCYCFVVKRHCVRIKQNGAQLFVDMIATPSNMDSDVQYYVCTISDSLKSFVKTWSATLAQSLKLRLCEVNSRQATINHNLTLRFPQCSPIKFLSLPSSVPSKVRMRSTTRWQSAQCCHLILAHFQHSKFNTHAYIHRIALSTMGTLHCLHVCIVPQCKQAFVQWKIFFEGALVLSCLWQLTNQLYSAPHLLTNHCRPPVTRYRAVWRHH